MERADFPFLATNVVEEDTGEAPDWLETSEVFNVNGIRVGVIGSVVRKTPELVSPTPPRASSSSTRPSGSRTRPPGSAARA